MNTLLIDLHTLSPVELKAFLNRWRKILPGGFVLAVVA